MTNPRPEGLGLVVIELLSKCYLLGGYVECVNHYAINVDGCNDVVASSGVANYTLEVRG